MLGFYPLGAAPLGSIPETTYATSVTPWINIGGVWKEATVWMNISGTWQIVTPYVKAGGIWRG